MGEALYASESLVDPVRSRAWVAGRGFSVEASSTCFSAGFEDDINGEGKGEGKVRSSLVWMIEVTIFSNSSEEMLHRLLLLEQESCLHILGRSLSVGEAAVQSTASSSAMESTLADSWGMSSEDCWIFLSISRGREPVGNDGVVASAAAQKVWWFQTLQAMFSSLLPLATESPHLVNTVWRHVSMRNPTF